MIGMTQEDPYLVDAYARLSHSKLWPIQKKYFIHQSIDAFKTEVPFYISSNVYIAKRYASLMMTFIQEWIVKHPDSAAKTFTMLELGAGSGKFSFYFLNEFTNLYKAEAQTFAWRYVITDVSRKSVDFCRNNEDFKPYIDNHILDFSNLDIDTDLDFELDILGQKYSESNPDTPLLVIANYAFDCMRQDLFTKQDGKLQEVQVEIRSRYPHFNQDKPEHLNELRFKYRNIDINLDNYYAESNWNVLLKRYEKDLVEGAMFPLPLTGFHFLSHITKINPQIFLICGDKGIALKEDLGVSSPQNQYTYDGCYSYNINFHALGQLCIEQQGSYIPTNHFNNFKVNLLSMGIDLDHFKKTKSEYTLLMESGGADEFCYLMSEFEQSSFRFDYKSISSFLRLSNWDPDVYCAIHDRLLELVGSVPYRLFKDLLKDIERVESNIYSLRRDPDPFNLLGIFYQACNMTDKAIQMYEKALSLHGERPAPHHNLGVVYEKIGNSDKAIVHFTAAVKLNNHNQYAKKRLYLLKGNFAALLLMPAIKLGTVLLGLSGLFWYFSR
jgi:tetratricopeptide (TPR) repeat protein